MQKIPMLIFLCMFFVTAGCATQPLCIPQSASNNMLVLENVCESRLYASCSCRAAQNGALCIVDLKENFVVSCGEHTCKAKILDDEIDIGSIKPSAAFVQFACKGISGAECKCANVDDYTVSCSVKGAKVYSVCNDKGCTFKVGERSKWFSFCDPILPIVLQNVSNSLMTSIDGIVIGEKEDHRLLEEGVISVTGTLDNGIGVEIAAEVGYIDNDSSVSAYSTDLKEHIREKFKEAVQLKYKGNVEYSTLGAIEINMHNLRDGIHIKSATIRFKVPKEQVSGEVVILRYTDDGNVEVLTPTILEEDGYYVYEVYTDGLSLYAVATVNQIAQPHSTSASSSSDGVMPQAAGCGTAATILAIIILLYTGTRDE